MSRLQRLERRIDQKLRQVLRSSSSTQRRELVEVHRAILDEIASRVDTLPRERRSFGYTRVSVCILLAEPERRLAYDAVFIEADALTRDIEDYFGECRVSFPPGLKVNVELVDTLPPDRSECGFDIGYSNVPDSSVSADLPHIQLTVLVGSAEQAEYRFTKQRINIGRLAEVLGADLRTVRRNDVALKDEAAGPNLTVSRTHAHIAFDRETSRFRLFDDASAYGTTVVRDGSVIPVPTGTSKGVLLETGDELILGKVRIRFEYSQA